MEKVEEFLGSDQFVWSIIVLLVGILLYLVLSRILDSLLKRKSKHIRLERRRKTYIKMARSVLRWVVVIVTILALLQVNGINISAILAGLGVASIIAGLALQDAFKDIIMGFNLIVDDYFAVGDVIEYEKRRGVVLELGLKVTKIRSLVDDGIVTIANRNINMIHVVSRQCDIDLSIGYEHKVEDVEAAIAAALKEFAKIPEIESAEYKGLEKFDDSAIIYKIRLAVKPVLQGQAKRDANRILKAELDARKISIPYPQLTVHNAKK